MIERRTFIASGLGCAMTAPRAAGAAGREKVLRIGYIQTATEAEQAHLTQALEQALLELGYAQGRNLVFERRFADGKPERLPDLALQLVRLEVDVIVTGSNPVIAAVKQATATIPVVMATSRDPVGSGFIASLSRPGGNITGMTGDPTPEMQGKRLELLLQAVPRARQVALLWNPLAPAAQTYRNEVESAARKLGVSLIAVEARGRGEFEAAFAAMAREGAQALVVLPDPLFFTARKQVVEWAASWRLPAIYHAREVVELGGLMSYGANLVDQFRRAAGYVDRILKGANPADMPVEQPTRFELVINLKAAKALGITIPPSLLLRADELIQ
jgi:putative tryptophan/tyrosine transport system substrate-binding protein